MKKTLVLMLTSVAVTFFATQTYGQVLFTGKTSGNKNGSFYLFGNASTVDSVASYNNWAGLVLGLTDRIDVVFGYGNMTTLGEQFPYAASGFVAGLPTKKLGFDAMVYQLFSLPNANRANTSPLFGNSVFIISKDLTIKGCTFTPYTGYTGNYAFGPKDRLLTFTKPTHQVPLGVFLPVSKNWGLTAEYDHGNMKSFGMALNYSFRYRYK